MSLEIGVKHPMCEGYTQIELTVHKFETFQLYFTSLFKTLFAIRVYKTMAAFQAYDEAYPSTPSMI